MLGRPQMTGNMELVLATRNKGKLDELKALLSGMPVKISTLDDYPAMPEVVEDGLTFLENAQKKAREVTAYTGQISLADDSGLEVEALNGAPGVMSARFAGKNGDHKANNEKLLKALSGMGDNNRRAAFVCTMVLSAPDGREWDVFGRCEGFIGRELQGSGGFGYDPLFYIPEYRRTMAELSMDEKNAVSHRGKALRQIKDVLLEILK